TVPFCRVSNTYVIAKSHTFKSANAANLYIGNRRRLIVMSRRNADGGEQLRRAFSITAKELMGGGRSNIARMALSVQDPRNYTTNRVPSAKLAEFFRKTIAL